MPHAAARLGRRTEGNAGVANAASRVVTNARATLGGVPRPTVGVTPAHITSHNGDRGSGGVDVRRAPARMLSRIEPAADRGRYAAVLRCDDPARASGETPMQRREEEHDAEASAWARATHRVVLATNSPFVQTFFQDLARDQMGSWAIHLVTVDVSGVNVDSPFLSDAAVAVLHTDPDLPAAQAVCAALGVSWPALPIIALSQAYARSRRGMSRHC